VQFGEGEVALFLLGEVQPEDGVKAVEQPAEFVEVVGVGHVVAEVDMAQERGCGRRVGR
jgi:hypothetical protein